MAFSDNEESVRLSQPTELFRFEYGIDQYLYYTHYHEDIALSATQVYKSTQIKRGTNASMTQTSKSDLTITVARDETISEIFNDDFTRVINLTIWRVQPDYTGSSNRIVTWSGRIVDYIYKDDELEIRTESVFTSLRRLGVTRTFSQNCPYTLFDNQCGATRGNYVHGMQIGTNDRKTLTVADAAGFENNYFGGGYLELNLSGKIQRRSIVSHVGDQIVLNYPLPDFDEGIQGIFYAGCDRQLGTCKNKFNNLLNFGGFPFVPTKNPFS